MYHDETTSSYTHPNITSHDHETITVIIKSRGKGDCFNTYVRKVQSLEELEESGIILAIDTFQCLQVQVLYQPRR